MRAKADFGLCSITLRRPVTGLIGMIVRCFVLSTICGSRMKFLVTVVLPQGGLPGMDIPLLGSLSPFDLATRASRAIVGRRWQAELNGPMAQA